MSPSPSSSLQGYARQFARSRRLRNTSPHSPSHATTPEARAASPLPYDVSGGRSEHTLDEGDDEDEEDQSHDLDHGLVESEEEEGADVVDITDEVEIDGGDGEGVHEEAPIDIESMFDPTGLKEIGNLASWTVSTCKPGCGVEALRDEDTNLFWQSDGPQPHHLNIHFSRLVSILSIRIYLDFEADESYTPTRITLLAGTGYHDLIPFSSLEFTQPKGWIDVPLDGVGGGPDGNTLRAFLVQVKVVENHQNGKDTHVRGLKIYARDERVGGNLGGLEDFAPDGRKDRTVKASMERTGMLSEPDWMGEAELR